MSWRCLVFYWGGGVGDGGGGDGEDNAGGDGEDIVGGGGGGIRGELLKAAWHCEKQDLNVACAAIPCTAVIIVLK